MTVRLGFAIAAHLEPEVLIVDEVLAVGDAEFQKKAVGKMQDVSQKEGRTVLFVSHNLNAVSLLCNGVLLLKEGRISIKGDTKNVINQYLEDKNILTGNNIDFKKIKRINSEIFFESLVFNNFPLKFGEDLELKIKIGRLTDNEFRNLEIGIGIQDSKKNRIIHISNKFINKEFTQNTSHQEYLFKIKNNLAPGIYELTLFLKTGNLIQDWLKDVVKFEILDGNPYRFPNTQLITGIIFPKFDITQI